MTKCVSIRYLVKDWPLAHQNIFGLLNFSSASIFKGLQCRSKLVKMYRCHKQLESGWDAELLNVSSGSKLFTYGTLDMLCGQRVNIFLKSIDIEITITFNVSTILYCCDSRINYAYICILNRKLLQEASD